MMRPFGQFWANAAAELPQEFTWESNFCEFFFQFAREIAQLTFVHCVSWAENTGNHRRDYDWTDREWIKRAENNENSARVRTSDRNEWWQALGSWMDTGILDDNLAKTTTRPATETFGSKSMRTLSVSTVQSSSQLFGTLESKAIERDHVTGRKVFLVH